MDWVGCRTDGDADGLSWPSLLGATVEPPFGATVGSRSIVEAVGNILLPRREEGDKVGLLVGVKSLVAEGVPLGVAVSTSLDLLGADEGNLDSPKVGVIVSSVEGSMVIPEDGPPVGVTGGTFVGFELVGLDVGANVGLPVG